MATAVVLPKQGNSVESCVIQRWMKNVGDAVKEGDGLCEVETDKATVEVPATASGVLLAIFRPTGDDVAVQTAICAIGAAGEDVAALAPAGSSNAAAAAPVAAQAAAAPAAPTSAPAVAVEAGLAAGSSPRARAAAAAAGIAIAQVPATGPNGLVIERDVQAVAAGHAKLTPAALAAGGSPGATGTGTGIGGRVTTADLTAPRAQDDRTTGRPDDRTGAVTDTAVKGIRKIIADRMRASLGGTAQLTMSAYAKAGAVQAWRARHKANAEALGLPAVSVNDLVLFAVSRTLPRFPALNAHFLGDKIRQFGDVNLGVAVDTDKGLMVPVLPQANRKSLAQIAAEFKPLAKACQAGKATPDQLSGSTFTVTNLGALGIETFTPVLNAPEVAILGVGGISLKAYEGATGPEFLPAMCLSLTIDHQALDGAPAARFLQALVQACLLYTSDAADDM
jgi:pyruvate dehydrogenase E2 component (dihydrolipoamide acetyltransferase)